MTATVMREAVTRLWHALKVAPLVCYACNAQAPQGTDGWSSWVIPGRFIWLCPPCSTGTQVAFSASAHPLEAQMSDKMGTHPTGNPSKDVHPADTRPDNQGPGAGDKGFGRETNTGRPADAKPAYPDSQPLKDRE